jgi:3-methyl-2-oxobutanoate hydroxymethyltransferase
MTTSLKVFSDYKKSDQSRGSQPLAMVSLYDAPSAKICCDQNVDALLVGDSMGNVILGFDNTVPVTIDAMVHHTGAVLRGVRSSSRPDVPVVADMPLGGGLHPDSFDWALRLMQTGSAAIKMEGASKKLLENIRMFSDAGIPVMGHLGYTPQSALRFKSVVQGRTQEDADRLLAQSLALQDAGCFAIVLETVVMEVAAQITDQLEIPTIGIGSGASCSGQVLVWNDLIGLSDVSLRMVKEFGNAREVLQNAAAGFVDEVHKSTFPTEEHGWKK